MVSNWLDWVVHWTSCLVNAYASPNLLKWCVDMSVLVESVCIHSMPLHPAYRFQSAQLARAAIKQQSSFWDSASLVTRAFISNVNSSLQLGIDSHHWTSSITFAMGGGASLVSAVDRKRGSILRNRPRNFATSRK
jgi:hypothetical protein